LTPYECASACKEVGRGPSTATCCFIWRTPSWLVRSAFRSRQHWNVSSTDTVEATGATSHSNSPFLAIQTGSICSRAEGAMYGTHLEFERNGVGGRGSLPANAVAQQRISALLLASDGATRCTANRRQLPKSEPLEAESLSDGPACRALVESSRRVL
jgi:hypothetical protein